jgi:conjugative relaxase-like TrwC/TraI family protein
VLSPKTQTNLKNAKGYFEEHLAVGDYYAEDQRVQGEWFGEGAALLGLNGKVTRDQFLALCENQHPGSRALLTQRQNTTRDDGAGEVANRRVFYDFTFSPPKSVSIAALVGGDERIVVAHNDALRIALKELEQFAAARVRAGKRNSDRRTRNIVAALFQHDTSRALDPHLHTHCIIFNATHDDREGCWKALQNYEMLAAQKYAENVYYHELARALRSCGYTIVNAARGDFAIAEISRDLCERFSKRHREIDEKTRAFLELYPDKQAGNEAAIREHIAHKDRARKTADVGSERLRELWFRQLSVEEADSLRQARHKDRQFEHHLCAAEAVTWAEKHLFERRSVVLEHELWRHALEAARGASVSLVEIKQETASRVYLRDETGKIAHRDVLAREWEIVKAARDGIGRHAPLATVPRTGGLAEDQSRALDAILKSRDLITLFRGGAGAGKSFVLRAVQQAVDRKNQRSVVLAPQRQQVIDLTRDGLTGTQTVRECLQRRDLAERGIVIVDEAGQLDGRQLLDLIRLVRERRGRLILCGDTRQHGPVEASDALRAIERYSGLHAAELNQIRRQEPKRGRTTAERRRIRNYREAVKAAAAGELRRSFEKLEELGAVAGCNLGEQSTRLCDAYLDIAAQGESAVVISQTRAEVREINDAIRGRLRERGLLAGSETEITALEQIDLTQAQKVDARHYPADCALVFNRDLNGCRRGERGKLIGITGKRIVLDVNGKVRHVPLTHLDYINVCWERELPLSPGDRLQLKANSATTDGRKLANGEIVTVAQIKSNGAIRLADGRVLPSCYRQFVRGYAVTSYASQGKTVDHVLFSDSAIRAATNAQQWYVTISRGRRSIKIFTPDKEQLRHAITRSGERELALDLLRARVRRHDLRYRVLHSIRRGREFARHIARMAMHCWITALIKSHLKPTHEIRNQQANRVVRASVLAT